MRKRSEIQEFGGSYLEGFGEFGDGINLDRGWTLAFKALYVFIGDLRFLSQLLLSPAVPFTEFPQSFAKLKPYITSHCEYKSKFNTPVIPPPKWGVFG